MCRALSCFPRKETFPAVRWGWGEPEAEGCLSEPAGAGRTRAHPRTCWGLLPPILCPPPCWLPSPSTCPGPLPALSLHTSASLHSGPCHGPSYFKRGVLLCSKLRLAGSPRPSPAVWLRSVVLLVEADCSVHPGELGLNPLLAASDWAALTGAGLGVCQGHGPLSRWPPHLPPILAPGIGDLLLEMLVSLATATKEAS